MLMAAVGVILMLRAPNAASQQAQSPPATQGEPAAKPPAGLREKIAIAQSPVNVDAVKTTPDAPKSIKVELPVQPPVHPPVQEERGTGGGMLAPVEDMRESLAQDKWNDILAFEKSAKFSAFDFRRRLLSFVNSSYKSTKAGKEAAEKLKSMPDTPLRPADKVEGTQPGLLASIYPKEGDSIAGWTPNPAKLEKTVTVPDVQLWDRGRLGQVFGREENLFVRIEGYVEIPKDGSYTFFTTSDDGSMLYIGELRIVDNDLPHGNLEVGGEIGLQAGKHAIHVDYFQGGGMGSIAISWSGPSIEKQIIPPSALSHK